MPVTKEQIARQVRDLLTSQSESLGLDIPQIMSAIDSALKAFYAEKLKTHEFRKSLPKERISFLASALNDGVITVPTTPDYLPQVINEAELWLEGFDFPVQMVASRERLMMPSHLSTIFIYGFWEDDKIYLTNDPTGLRIDNIAGYWIVPNLSLDITKLPQNFLGEFILFVADLLRDQVVRG